MMLKHSVVVLISTQEELNQFAELEDVPEDALHIDEDYVAYMDDVLYVVPYSQIDETHFMRHVKPTLFRKWYKKNKEIR